MHCCLNPLSVCINSFIIDLTCSPLFTLIYFSSFQKSSLEGVPQYSIVGYLTMYDYYAYPDKIKPRIRYNHSLSLCLSLLCFLSYSQVLILPPYQRRRLGSKYCYLQVSLKAWSWFIYVAELLRSVYNDVLADHRVLEILGTELHVCTCVYS